MRSLSSPALSRHPWVLLRWLNFHICVRYLFPSLSRTTCASHRYRLFAFAVTAISFHTAVCNDSSLGVSILALFSHLHCWLNFDNRVGFQYCPTLLPRAACASLICSFAVTGIGFNAFDCSDCILERTAAAPFRCSLFLISFVIGICSWFWSLHLGGSAIASSEMIAVIATFALTIIDFFAYCVSHRNRNRRFRFRWPTLAFSMIWLILGWIYCLSRSASALFRH
mmetsp:Transcript_32468/g.68607  ORF Transcript_32468/g.68607 Transcript_32468/m.68607 type:complete len:225 (+) Transcript_32468:569-1243(+)